MKIVDHLDPWTYWIADQQNSEVKCYIEAFNATFEDFRNTLSDVRSIGFEHEGKPVGGAIIDKNDFFHIAVLPEYYGRIGFVFYKSLKWAFSQSNTLYGLIDYRNERAVSLVTKQKFPVIWNNGTFFLHKMTAENTRYTHG